MKNNKLVHISIILVLIIFSYIVSGCSQPKYNKTISAYVLVGETDDISLDNATIENFMTEYYKNSDIEFTVNQVKESDRGIVSCFNVTNKKRDLSILQNDDAGFCYEYETVEYAKEDWESYYFINFSNVSSMQMFCVRVGNYIFANGADIWKPLFDKIGITLEKQTFSVADENNVTYEEIENHDLDKIIKTLKKNNYSITNILQEDPDYTVVSASGDETYTIISSEYIFKMFKKNKKNINDYWFHDYVPGIMTSCGLTVYTTNEYVVISRGDSWRKLLNKIL